jgi:hypothetical protein
VVVSLRHPRPGSPGPARCLPERQPGSVRRTTCTDILRPDGIAGDVMLAGSGRDVRTGTDGSAGSAEVLARASLELRIDFHGGRTVRSITSDPVRPALQELAGLPASSGFRDRAAAALPEDGPDRDLLYQLLDDVPAATLIAGYAVGAAAGSHGRGRSSQLGRPDVHRLRGLQGGPGQLHPDSGARAG